MNQETAKKLFEYRKANGYSQEELALKIGVSRQFDNKSAVLIKSAHKFCVLGWVCTSDDSFQPVSLCFHGLILWG